MEKIKTLQDLQNRLNEIKKEVSEIGVKLENIPLIQDNGNDISGLNLKYLDEITAYIE